MNPDGSGRTFLTKGKSPIFSPEGRRIAYVETDNTGTAINANRLMTINLDGSNRQPLCPPPTSYIGVGNLLRWSPRDRYIAAIMTVGRDGLPPVANCSVTAKTINYNRDNKNEYLLIFDWTPDGENAIWQIFDKNGFTIYYGDPDLSPTSGTRLTNYQYGVGEKPEECGQGICILQHYMFARISPDSKTVATIGTKIFFVGIPGQNSPLQGKALDDIGDPTNPNSKYFGVATRLAWSPDSQALAVVESAYDSSGRYNYAAFKLKIVNLSGGTPGKSTVISDNVVSVDWSSQ